MKHVLALSLSFFIATHPAVACEEHPLTAETVLSRISGEGGHAVLWDLWDHPDAFGRVIAGIESADGSWLEVASALKPFADAGASLSLNYAVANALPKAPEKVLSLVGRGFDVDYICTSPFIEPEPGVAEAYERDTLVALASVKDPSLVAIAAECTTRVRLPGPN